ncbi:MAG: fructose-6-phosphate aldolase [Deltaproteobacteria bacterium]|nr:fructose-6-phosphate aldolase [Deltaproteobacteria bacterium]
MEFFLDTANLVEIREAASWGILDGCTTNPSLIAREGRDFVATIAEICEIVRGPVSAEVVATHAAGMVEEGRLLARISEHVVVKVPLDAEGIKATKILSGEGVRCNVTLCFQPAQALLAAKAGAAYVSPFVGRLDDVGIEGMDLVRQILEIYANYPQYTTKVLVASVRHPMHVVEAARLGADVITLPFGVFRRLVQHPLTDKGIQAFTEDWKKVPDTDIVGQVGRWLEAHGR